MHTATNAAAGARISFAAEVLEMQYLCWGTANPPFPQICHYDQKGYQAMICGCS